MVFDRELRITGDGSYTLHIPEWDEQYHSKHGAIREALHVFIQEGLTFLLTHKEGPLSILEVGFGTGLNAILTSLYAVEKDVELYYKTLEAYPVPIDFIRELNFPEHLHFPQEQFLLLHELSWEEDHNISAQFTFRKEQRRFEEINEKGVFDLIYFDAFGIRVQPELWTESLFQKLFNALKPGGVLVTYASNGSARRALKAVGFNVEKIPGPPGKKEMMRAVKNG